MQILLCRGTDLGTVGFNRFLFRTFMLFMPQISQRAALGSIMVPKEEVDCLRKRWDELCATLKINSGACARWGQYLLDEYSAHERQYHTLRHLSELFWHLDRATANGWLARPDNVALAIWFHDVIYHGKNKDDEEASAIEFERFGEEVGLEASDTASVAAWIRLTATHKCSEAAHGRDCCFFMDFDMAILGKPWGRSWEGCPVAPETGYSDYALRDVIVEYRKLHRFPAVLAPFFVGGVWCWGRARFLTSAGSPFTTAEYRKLYEAEAQQNVGKELDHWQSVQRRVLWWSRAAAALATAASTAWAVRFFR